MYSCAYTVSVEVEWDGRKAEANLRKHGIAFEDALTVLYDDNAVAVMDQQGETRVVRIGSDSLGRILVIVYAFCGIAFRMISARRATARERRRYSEER
jgi:uncharacterized protein